MSSAFWLYEMRIVLMVFCADWFICDRCWCRSKLENEITIVLWLLWNFLQKWQEMNNSRFVREMVINDIEGTFRSNIRSSSYFNIEQKKMYISFFSITNIIIKSISINHPLDFHWKRINNPWCIVYEHLMGLKIKGRFSKGGH